MKIFKMFIYQNLNKKRNSFKFKKNTFPSIMTSITPSSIIKKQYAGSPYSKINV